MNLKEIEKEGAINGLLAAKARHQEYIKNNESSIAEIDERIAVLQNGAANPDPISKLASDIGKAKKRTVNKIGRMGHAYRDPGKKSKVAGLIPDGYHPNRTMSAAGRKRVAAAQRARWSKYRKAQKKRDK